MYVSDEIIWTNLVLLALVIMAVAVGLQTFTVVLQIED